MRALLTLLVSTASLFSGLAVSVAQEPSASPSPTPPQHSEDFPLDTKQTPWGAFWIGWGELPWTWPTNVTVGAVNTSPIHFTSPLVPVILGRAGVPVLVQNGSMTGGTLPSVSIPLVQPGNGKRPGASPTPGPGTLTLTGLQAADLATIETSIPSLQKQLSSVRLLSIPDQSVVIQALLASWTQFYTLAGPVVPHAVTHFAKERAALQLRADKEGITPELLEDCRKYQAELNAATSQ